MSEGSRPHLDGAGQRGVQVGTSGKDVADMWGRIRVQPPAVPLQDLLVVEHVKVGPPQENLEETLL